MRRIVMAFGVACLVCGFANAQDQEKAAREKMQVEQAQLSLRRGVPEMQDAGVMFGEVVKGAPFTAQRTEESTQTLGDGTHINHKSSISYARDSAGRVRREDDEWITIYDPVANVSYRLNKKNHTGNKVELLRGEAKIKLDEINQERADQLKVQSEKALAEDKARQENAVVISDQGADGRVYSFRKDGNEEALGSQVVNGVMADGMRTTYTIPAGDFGNDRPITSTTESWYSPDLHLTVMYKRSDPREGDVVTQYTGIKRAEPDPSLFQMPAGYTLNQNQERRRQEEIQ
nr:hypothetical protein [Candidatus Acidoferrales bacterium]